MVLKRQFLFTFDWVVNFLHNFNQQEIKDRTKLTKLKYVFKLALQRGFKNSMSFFDQLCHACLPLDDIKKSTLKLSEYVSAEEMKLLLVNQQKITAT